MSPSIQLVLDLGVATGRNRFMETLETIRAQGLKVGGLWFAKTHIP